MRRALGAVLVVVAVTTIGLGAALLARERGGPPHRDVTLPGGVPATLYFPGAPGAGKPPAVVVAHGYSGDRATMSSLSRSLAVAGYAVLAIDFRGHGANPASFSDGDRSEDLVAALDWLEASPEVDPERLAILGHSMGAHAALDVVLRDERSDAAVVLGSAYRASAGEGEPPDVLFLVGENEPASVAAASEAFAAELAAAGARTEVAEVDGANHITILWFDEAAAEAVAWFDDAFGIERDAPAEIVDPRLGIAGAYFLCALAALAGLGVAAGHLAPKVPRRDAAGLAPFGAVVLALAIAAPVAAVGLRGPFATGFGDVIAYLGAAGFVLLVVRRRVPSLPSRDTVLRGAAGAGAAIAGAFVLLAPLGGVTHRLVPTPHRALLALVATIALLPFFTMLQASLRCGPLWRATASSIAGHGLALVALAAGVVVGALPGVVALALPLLAGVFGFAEVFGIAAYSVTRNGAFVGAVEASWVAGIAAVAMPLP